jgi:hypothetical protein
MALLTRTEWLRLKLGRGFELAGACTVVVLGLAMLNR